MLTALKGLLSLDLELCSSGAAASKIIRTDQAKIVR